MPDLLTLEMESGNFTLGEGDFLFCLDETGHEGFANPDNVVFGLGGIGIAAPQYAASIEFPWRQMKADWFENETVVLHASARQHTKDQLVAIGAYFQNYAFSRLAITCAKNTSLHSNDYEAAFEICAATLRTRMLRQAANYKDLRRIVVIVEHSERLHRLYVKYLQLPPSLQVTESNGATRQLPVLQGIAGKGVIQGLEVADYTLHAAQGTAREFARGNIPKPRRKDFDVVFPNEAGFVEFLHINSAQSTAVH